MNEPRGAKTPLSKALEQLQERLRQLQPAGQDGRRVMVSIITDGSGVALAPKRSRDQTKENHRAQLKLHDQQCACQRAELVQQLHMFTSTWNAFVVIRLTTDNKSTVDHYNTMDKDLELPVDVVDDLQGEAQEVYSAGNGWFAYTPMIHQMRERGCTFEKLFELLDERTLGLSEIAKFMELFFREPDEKPYPRHPATLLTLAGEINARSALVYDARLDKMVPPLNMKQLRKALRLSLSQRMKSMRKRITATMACSSRLPRD